jgi:hypothetical protein
MTQKDPLADLSWPGASVTPSPACSEAIRGVCTKGLENKRGVSATGRALLTLGLCVALIGLYSWHGMSEHASPVVRTALFGAIGWFGAQTLLVFATLARPPGKRGSRQLRLAMLIAVPVLFTIYLALTSTETFAFARFSHGAPAAHAIGCGFVALFMGTLIAGAALVAWRRTDPYNPGLSGATIGMVAGLASGSGMSVACASHEALHACFAHGAIVVALSVAGFALGRRFLTP